MIHATQPCLAGVAGLRDLDEADIEAVVDYWHGGIADLDHLGIDLARMGTPADMRAWYVARLRSGDRAQRQIAYAITLDGQMVGYTQLNQYPGGVGFSHWHVTARQARASGLSSALYPFRIRMYFETSNIERLTHQTRTRNVGVNRMLDRFVAIAETCHVDNPDGLALPGEFHIRYVTREDLPRLLALAGQHASSPDGR